uniref:Uncharacterized protein n=1 Tax=Oryza glaberrima TaxID=4538 RepID=I1P0A7_ORYGL
MASHHAHCRSVCKYVVRCIIHSRYPIGTKFDTCGITADTQVLNLIPGTCEVSSIMAGCEVSHVEARETEEDPCNAPIFVQD